MTVYLVLVWSDNIVSVDVYQCQDDAQRRLKRAQANFPQHEGWSVSLLEKWASPDQSATFQS